MLFELIATLCAGLFAGAAIYITLVEHPARVECGTAVAAIDFGPSYRRAAVMQASLALSGLLAALAAWVQGRDGLVLFGGGLLGLVVLLSGCTYWVPYALPPASAEPARLPRTLRLGTAAGAPIVVSEPVRRGDSVFAQVGPDTVAFALTELRQLERSYVNGPKTAGLAVGVLVVTSGIGLLTGGLE